MCRASGVCVCRFDASSAVLGAAFSSKRAQRVTHATEPAAAAAPSRADARRLCNEYACMTHGGGGHRQYGP